MLASPTVAKLTRPTPEYAERSTTSFIDALYDYERSNDLLFDGNEEIKTGGWHLPADLERAREQAISSSLEEGVDKRG